MAKHAHMRPVLQEIAGRSGVTVPWDRITVVQWKPDTCASPPCIVWQWQDDAAPDVVLWARTIRACSAHSTAPLDESLWHTVRGEASRKNAAIVAARGVAGIADGVRFAWSFDDAARVIDGQQRVVSVTVPGINQQQQTQIQAVVDVRFGPGLIVINRG